VQVTADAVGAAERLVTVTEMVERYAPDAIQNEAVIRMAGWLRDSPASGILEIQRDMRGFMHHRPGINRRAVLQRRHEPAPALRAGWCRDLLAIVRAALADPALCPAGDATDRDPLHGRVRGRGRRQRHLAGRAWAFQSMVAAGMELERAAILAGVRTFETA
jgi:hypothetical protein